MSLANTLLRNSLWNVSGKIISVAVGFLLTPYILSSLGQEAFGLWALAAVTINYLGLVDLGVSSAFLREIARHQAREDTAATEEVVHTGMVFYGLLFALLTPVIVVITPPVLGLMQVPAEFQPVAFEVFLGIFAIMAIRQTTAAFRLLLLGTQRMHVANAVVITSALLHGVLTIAVLAAGWGLRGLVIEGLFQAVFCACANAWGCRRTMGHVRLLPRRLRARALPGLISYGVRAQGASLAEMVNGQVDKIVLGSLVGLAAVAHYELGAKIAIQTGWLPMFLLVPLTPAAAELQAKGDADGVRRLTTRSTRHMLRVLAPFGALIAVEATPILTLWLGRPQVGADTVLALRMLALAFLISFLAVPGRFVARGLGAPSLELKVSVGMALANLLLSVALTPVWGLRGALWGTAVSLVGGTVAFGWIFHRQIGVGLGRLVREAYLPGLAPPAAACLLLLAGLSWLPQPGGRAAALLHLAGSTTFLVLATAAWAWGLRLWDEEDRDMVLRVLRLLRLRRSAGEATA